MSAERPVKIMLVVGEPSGDALGAQLLAALNKIAGGRVTYCGVGGTRMQAEGFQSLFSLDDTSVMGLKEVVPKIPAILARVREAANFAISQRPDIVVLIDSPDFTHRIARRLKRLAPGIMIAKYVAPQVWASRPWRAKSLAEFVDHLLVLLPFEPAFFEQYGLVTHFVGHPVIERIPKVSQAQIEAFWRDQGLGAGSPQLVVLLGSRANEVRFLGPAFSQTVRRLCAEMPDLRILVPTVPHLRERVDALVSDWPGSPIVTDDQNEKFIAFRSGTAALAVSGTVTTEAALAGLPMVVGYRLGWMTAMIARRLMVAKYFTLLNLIADEMIIPEFRQEECTPGALVDALRPLLTDTPVRRRQIADAERALQELGHGSMRPSQMAAEVVLRIAHAQADKASTPNATPTNSSVGASQ